MTAAEIAAAEGLSEPYVAKLLRLLRQAELVESIRGAQGGYRLARPASELFLSAVVRALGGDLYTPDFCQRFSGDRSVCAHTCECGLRALWAGIGDVVRGLLERCSLEQLARSEHDMRGWVATQLAAIARSDVGIARSDVGIARHDAAVTRSDAPA